MDPKQRLQGILGTVVLAGFVAAGLLAFDVSASARQHVHCDAENECKNVICEEEYPGFECHVTDDDVCNCVGIGASPAA